MGEPGRKHRDMNEEYKMLCGYVHPKLEPRPRRPQNNQPDHVNNYAEPRVLPITPVYLYGHRPARRLEREAVRIKMKGERKRITKGGTIRYAGRGWSTKDAAATKAASGSKRVPQDTISTTQRRATGKRRRGA
jgi:hypothetical protein